MKTYNIKITHWGTHQRGNEIIAAPVTDTIKGVPEGSFEFGPYGIDIRYATGYTQTYYSPIKLEIRETK